MELEIVGKRENPLLKRTEVQFRVTHPHEQTPKRGDLRQELANVLHVTRDIVIVDSFQSEFGRSASRGYAKVYKSKEDALKVERKHILVRNGLIAAEVKEKKEAPPKPVKPARKEAPKPAEAAPAKEEAPKAAPEKKEGKAPAEKKGEKPAAEKKEEAKPAAKKEEKKPDGKKAGKEGK
jgi:small subunit ribosomal protein S24e